MRWYSQLSIQIVNLRRAAKSRGLRVSKDRRLSETPYRAMHPRAAKGLQSHQGHRRESGAGDNLTRRVAGLSIITLMLLSIAAPVLAVASYSAPLTITSASATSYTMLAVQTTASNTWLANNGYMNSSANDTRIETLGGLVYPHMVAGDRTLTAAPVPTGSQTNLFFTTGNTVPTAMSVITGWGGYLMVTDNTTLEPSANFSITQTGHWGDSGYSVNKGFEYQQHLASGNLTATIGGYYSVTQIRMRFHHSGAPTNASVHEVQFFEPATWTWVAPTGNSDPSTLWTNKPNAYDSDTGTYTNSTTFAVGWQADYLYLTRAATTVPIVRIWENGGAAIDQIELQAYYGGAWHAVYTGAYTKGAYVNYALPPMATVSYPVSGYHTVTVIADGANMQMFIDGAAGPGTALSGPMYDGIDPWVFAESAALPYMTSMTYSVGGNQRLWYQPTSMIIGTTMPDRAAPAEDAVITWGTNPAGVTVTMSSFTASGTATTGSVVTAPPQEILPEAPGRDWFVEPDVTGALLTNPFRPFVRIMVGPTLLTESQAWKFFGLLILLVTFVGSAGLLKWRHMGIACIATSAVIIGLVATTIWPWYAIMLTVGGLFAGIVMERHQSF